MSFLGYPYCYPVGIRSNMPRFQTRAMSGHTVLLTRGKQRWELDITFKGGTNDNLFTDFMAHYYGNRNTSFTIPMPQVVDVTPNDVYANSISLVSSVSDQSIDFTVVAIDNSTNSRQHQVSSYVRIGTKVYQINGIKINNPSANTFHEVLSMYPLAQANYTTSNNIEFPTSTNTVNITVVHDFKREPFTFRNGDHQYLSCTFLEHI